MNISKFEYKGQTRYIKGVEIQGDKEYYILDKGEKVLVDYTYYKGIKSVPYFILEGTIIYLDDVEDLI